MKTAPSSLQQVMRSPGLRLWLALWTVYLVWGSTYLAIKLAVRTLPPVLTAGTRFLLAAAVLAGILTLARRTLRTTRHEALTAAGLGVVLLGAGVGMVHVAETRIDSSVAAMIAGSVPLQVVAWRTLARDRVPAADGARGARRHRRARARRASERHRERLDGGRPAGHGRRVDGLVARLVRREQAAASRRPVRRHDVRDARRRPGARRHGDASRRVGAGRRAPRSPPAPSLRGSTSALAGSVVGFSAYVWLLGNAPISQVVTHQYVNPIVAIGLGALLLGERPSPATLVGAGLVIGAVVVTVRRESIAAARREPVPEVAKVPAGLKPAAESEG